MRIETQRFLLRCLEPATDDLSSYLSWIRDRDSNPFIRGVDPKTTIADLKEYVLEKNSSNNSLLLGIFEKSGLQHVGNVKLEPIIRNQYAVVGILVGDKGWRGHGVGFEVLSKLCYIIFAELNLKELHLGVDQRNLVAQALYLKLGFQYVEEEIKDEAIRKMVLKKGS
jgi:ribosomal-protein-alanine N-acetyltransferase